jgi:hypothetical protein
MLAEYRLGINLIFFHYWFVILVKKDRTRIMKSPFFKNINTNKFGNLFARLIDIILISILVIITNFSLCVFTIVVANLTFNSLFGFDLIRYLARLY